jgi:hypothetical protein
MQRLHQRNVTDTKDLSLLKIIQFYINLKRLNNKKTIRTVLHLKLKGKQVLNLKYL